PTKQGSLVWGYYYADMVHGISVSNGGQSPMIPMVVGSSIERDAPSEASTTDGAMELSVSVNFWDARPTLSADSLELQSDGSLAYIYSADRILADGVHPTAGFYWATGTSVSDILPGPAIEEFSIDHNTYEEKGTIPPSLLQDAPPAARYVVFAIDR